MKKRLVTIALALVMVLSMISVSPVQTTAASSASVFTLKGLAGTKKITYSWPSISGASKYKLYIGSCDGAADSYKLVKTTTAVRVIKTKLKAGKKYKAYVTAYGKSGEVIAKSMVCHVQVKGGNKSNAKKVTATASLSLKEEATASIKASITKKDGKKVLLYEKHCNKIRYYSANKSVATVSASGQVTAVKAGTTYVYSVAPNGVYAKTKVMVTAEKKTAKNVTIRLYSLAAESMEDYIPLDLKVSTYEDLLKNGLEYKVDLSEYPSWGYGNATIGIRFYADYLDLESGQVGSFSVLANLAKEGKLKDNNGNLYSANAKYLMADVVFHYGADAGSEAGTASYGSCFVPSLDMTAKTIYLNPTEGSIKDNDFWFLIPFEEVQQAQ